MQATKRPSNVDLAAIEHRRRRFQKLADDVFFRGKECGGKSLMVSPPSRPTTNETELVNIRLPTAGQFSVAVDTAGIASHRQPLMAHCEWPPGDQ